MMKHTKSPDRQQLYPALKLWWDELRAGQAVERRPAILTINKEQAAELKMFGPRGRS